jgi:prephenate dehydrogenase
MNIVIVGLGLIGGSLAKAFSEYTEHRVTGIDAVDAVAQRALACGAVHAVGDERALGEADVVYLCLYPRAAVNYVEKHLGCFRKGCVVTDTAGIKGLVCKELPPLAERGGFSFAGSHPMAGKEKSGFDASEAALFNGASYLLVPCMANQRAIDTLSHLALELGFGGVKLTTAEEHDRMIAFTSQLPHLLAAAYVLSPQCPNHRGFSAGSYRDVSRVARINEVLWSELFLSNRDPLLAELDGLLERLGALRAALGEGDREALGALLRRGREIKEELGE